VRYGSVCSGIETASLAFPSTWTPAWFSEVDPFCCALLKERYPHVENLGDLTKIEAVPAVDLIVAGTPCQSFSVQGKQNGLDDARGRLALRFCELVGQCRPRWIVWENVPGVLTTDSGRAFGAFLGGLAKLGYGTAYRVLDAQYFGVPQRRRRVFVVGHYRDWRSAAAVLFDWPQHRPHEIAASEVPGQVQRIAGCPEPLLGWTGDETPKFGVEIVPTLRAQQGGEGVGIIGRGMLRRLTITEWERLQGIKDGYTDIPGWSESQRRKAIGNAFCVNVIRWIGRRIDELSAHG
jgi:DNA (cytosine-5)-methyltransferase 1